MMNQKKTWEWVSRTAAILTIATFLTGLFTLQHWLSPLIELFRESPDTANHDPETPRIDPKIARSEETIEAEVLSHMTEERFAAVKKGMDREEIRRLLGSPKPVNVREFDGGVIGWFYPKKDPNTAAGVYFRKKNHQYVVYSADFIAIRRAPQV